MILSFESLLLISTAVFFVCLMLLAYRVGSLQNEARLIEQASASDKSTIQRILAKIHYLLLLAFVVVSGLAVMLGGRTWICYALEGALFLSLIVQVRLQGRDARRSTVFTLSVVAIVVCSLPLLENRLFIFGGDQPRDWIASASVLSSGNLGYAAAVSGGYYSFLPSLASLIAVLGISGHLPTSLTYLVLTATIGLLLTLSMFSVLDRLLNNQTAGIICVFFLLSTPRLSSVDLIPQVLSLALASTLILIMLVRKSTTADVLAIFVIYFATLTVHPSGVLAFGLVVAALILERKLADIKSLPRLPRDTIRFAIVLVMIAGLYWTFNGAVLLALDVPFMALLSSLSSLGIARATVSGYTPNYFAGPVIYALAWSLPVAASAAYLVASAVRRIKHRAASDSSSRLLEIMAVFGLLAIGTAFLGVVANPGASTERYADSVGYILLLLPSAALVSSIAAKGRVAEVAVVFAILFLVLWVGASSPDWSPTEATQFGTVHITYVGYQEAFALSPMLPSSCRIYSANDIDFVLPSSLLGIPSCSGVGSEQNARPVITSVESGVLPTGAVSEGYTLFVISTPRTNQTAVASLTLEVPYSSAYHIIALEHK